MKWQLIQPQLGDMVRVRVGEIYHYGVYVSDDEIIQFGLAPQARSGIKDSDVEVVSSDVDAFLLGGFLEVAQFDKKESKTRVKPQITVEKARSRLGEKGYNILYNNCEHFAYECVTGKKYCSQTDGLREKFHAFPVLNVLVAEIPTDGEVGEVYPELRSKEISLCKNERVRLQKYYVWKLLEYGLQWTFGCKIENVRFEKGKNGKWSCDRCEFSLSHSENVVAVALSRKPVGVDVEIITPPVVKGLENKILTREERAEFDAIDGDKTSFLIEQWSKKESVFKSRNEKSFLPKKISDYAFTQTYTLDMAGGRYSFSVTGESIAKLRIKTDVKL